MGVQLGSMSYDKSSYHIYHCWMGEGDVLVMFTCIVGSLMAAYYMCIVLEAHTLHCSN